MGKGENERLLECFKSGQMSDRQWLEHLKDGDFRDFVKNRNFEGPRVAGLFRFSLVPDWWEILKRAWSVRLMIVAFLLTVAEVLLPYFGGWIDPGVLGPLAALSTAGAFIARLLAQRDLKDG